MRSLSRTLRAFSRTLATASRFRTRTPTQPLLLTPLATHTGIPSYLARIQARTMATSNAPVLAQPLKLSCIQLASGPDKAANLAHARDMVLSAARDGAKLVVLPECFNSPYGCEYFPSYAETLLPSPPTAEQAPSYHALSSMAAEANVFLVGGSIPEADPDPNAKKYYNTCLTFGPDGSLLGTHRKVHLFDIDIPGEIVFRESAVLFPGNKVTIVELPGYGKIGVAICYDVRFPELATIAARRGAFALVYPGAFNTTTGPLHWALLGRARAADNQMYVALCSPARDEAASYRAYGHTLVADPMARVLEEAGEGEQIVSCELDGALIAETRRHIPLSTQRRFDVYPDVNAGKIRFKEPGLVEGSEEAKEGPMLVKRRSGVGFKFVGGNKK